MRRNKYIPQTDPGIGFIQDARMLERAMRRVLRSGRYILGSEVADFEKEFAEWLGGGNAVGVANGTDALELALRGCGVGHGDVVFTVSLTAVATVAAICRCGATPVFIDVQADTLQMDPLDLEYKIKRTPVRLAKAIVPVHLYGFMADMNSIICTARHHGLKLVEDCAQAHGAECRFNGKWIKAGRIGDAAAFSFYPTKNLAAMGDGGLVLTKTVGCANKIKGLRQYGWDQRRNSLVIGMNSRLDELQAAFLRERLNVLDQRNEARRKIANLYDNAFSGTEVVSVISPAWSRPVYHQYVVRVSKRDRIRKSLHEAGVGTSVHYPVPVHRQPAYQGFARNDSLQVTDAACKDILSLPIYPELTERDASRVARELLSAL